LNQSTYQALRDFKTCDYSPTNRQKLEAQKTCDIIIPDFKAEVVLSAM